MVVRSDNVMVLHFLGGDSDEAFVEDDGDDDNMDLLGQNARCMTNFLYKYSGTKELMILVSTMSKTKHINIQEFLVLSLMKLCHIK